MNYISLYTKLNLLPENLKKEVFNFVEILLKKNSMAKKKAHPKAGFMKGMFIIGTDFDEPLEDFKEYM